MSLSNIHDSSKDKKECHVEHEKGGLNSKTRRLLVQRVEVKE